MANKRKHGTILVATGLLCIAAALFLAGKNLWDEYKAGVAVSHVLAEFQAQVPGTAQGQASGGGEDAAGLADYLLNPDMEMPVCEIEGNYYIGVLEVPALGLSLPVMSEWSYENLKIAPCRYSGSAYTGNFTIAGHNYSTHFGPIGNLTAKAQITFTDAKGRSFFYEVQAVEVLEATAVEDMLSDQWDLTLFTCTSSGQARVTVRCLKTGQAG